MSGRLGARYGSRVPLALGALSSGLSYAWLAAFHDARIDIYLASVLLGLGVGLALAAMANLVVEAVPPDVTGVASAINAIMRTIGGASAPRWPPRSSAGRSPKARTTRRSRASRAPSR